MNLNRKINVNQKIKINSKHQTTQACYTNHKTTQACYTNHQTTQSCYTNHQTTQAFYTKHQTTQACYTKHQTTQAFYISLVKQTNYNHITHDMWTQNCVVIPAVIEYCITNQDIIDRCDTQDILNYVIK